ncbi:hypothetical protein GCM10010341_91910 [Streptomyces noursei]|nr:hypothetical protein GCM10010341_91910 [Streptomyces noursei]
MSFPRLDLVFDEKAPSFYRVLLAVDHNRLYVAPGDGQRAGAGFVLHQGRHAPLEGPRTAL